MKRTDLEKGLGNFIISNDCHAEGGPTCLSKEGQRVLHDMDVDSRRLCPVCAITWHLRRAKELMELI